MKRKLCALLAAISLFTTSLTFTYLKTSNVQAAVKLGDINSDGNIDSSDLTLIKGYLLGTSTLTDSQIQAADVDVSSSVNAIDLSYIKEYLLGSITKFPGDTTQTSGVGVTWMDGKTLFPLGVNYAWDNWSYEFSDTNWDTNFAKMKSDMDTMSTEGVHSLRWWVFPDLAYGPIWSGSGEGSLCTGLPTNWVTHMKQVCDYAYSKNIKIYWTLTSFDAARPDDSVDHDDIIDNAQVRQSFLDNAVKPIVQALGNNPGVFGWDCINEPEWIIRSEDGGAPRTDGYEIFTLDSMRSYIKTTAAYIKQYAKQPVSFGSANMKWLGAQYDLWDGLGLDFYDFHWYDWATPWFNPVTTPASTLKLDKPVIIGEMMPDTIDSSLKMTHKQVLDAIYANGYAGYMLWAWNDSNTNCKAYIGDNFTSFGAEHKDVVR